MKNLSDGGGGGAQTPAQGYPGTWLGAPADFRDDDCPDPCDRFRLIVAHEIGHAIGFRHSTISSDLFGNDATPVMYYAAHQPLALTPDDVAVVSTAYPEPGTPLASVSGRLHGRCVNPATQQPVSGVNVIAVDTGTGVPAVARLSGAGGEAGAFDLVGLPPGTYELQFLDGDSTRGTSLGLGSSQIQADNFTTFTTGPFVVAAGGVQDVGTVAVAIGPAELAPGSTLPPATGGIAYTTEVGLVGGVRPIHLIDQEGLPPGLFAVIENMITFTYEFSGHHTIRIFGTPQAAGLFRATFTLRDAHGVESEVSMDLAVADSLPNPVCTGGAGITKTRLTVKKLGLPAGDETLDFRGSAGFPAGTLPTLDLVGKGAQLLIEDLGTGAATVFALTAASDTPIPPESVGRCDATRDGWKLAGATQSYTNRSTAIDPPVCTPGSANGLTALKIKDRRATRDSVEVSAKIKGALFASTPVGPLRATIVFGATTTESDGGECASTGATGAVPCTSNASGTSLRCRLVEL